MTFDVESLAIAATALLVRMQPLVIIVCLLPEELGG
jgi:hypothetical protein